MVKIMYIYTYLFTLPHIWVCAGDTDLMVLVLQKSEINIKQGLGMGLESPGGILMTSFGRGSIGKVPLAQHESNCCQEEIAATAHKNDIAACHDFGVSIAHGKNDLEAG